MYFVRLFKPKPDVQELRRNGDVQGLIRALRYRRDADVRLAAAKALGRIGGAMATEPLVQALGDKFVRWEAAAALERIGEPARDSLIQALNHRDMYVRKAAKKALEIINPY